jgi:hypothetical protein
MRNTIYEYCVDDHDHADTKEKYGDPHGHAQRTFLNPASSHWSLTRVNQSIRAEFLSLYLRKSPKWVPVRQFLDYMSIFHNGYDSGKAIADNVSVDNLRICDRERRVDLLPVLRIMASHRQFKSDFVHHVRDCIGAGLNDLADLLNQCERTMSAPGWHIAEAKLTSDDPNINTKNLVVDVRIEFKLKALARKTFEAQLLVDLGLHGRVGWKAIIKYV